MILNYLTNLIYTVEMHGKTSFYKQKKNIGNL